MGAVAVHQPELPATVAEEHEVLAEPAKREGELADLRAHRDRMPEAPQVLAPRGVRPHPHEQLVGSGRRRLRLLVAAESSRLAVHRRYIHCRYVASSCRRPPRAGRRERAAHGGEGGACNLVVEDSTAPRSGQRRTGRPAREQRESPRRPPATGAPASSSRRRPSSRRRLEPIGHPGGERAVHVEVEGGPIVHPVEDGARFREGSPRRAPGGECLGVEVHSRRLREHVEGLGAGDAKDPVRIGDEDGRGEGGGERVLEAAQPLVLVRERRLQQPFVRSETEREDAGPARDEPGGRGAARSRAPIRAWRAPPPARGG